MRTLTELNVPRRIAWRVMMCGKWAVAYCDTPGCGTISDALNKPHRRSSWRVRLFVAGNHPSGKRTNRLRHGVRRGSWLLVIDRACGRGAGTRTALLEVFGLFSVQAGERGFCYYLGLDIGPPPPSCCSGVVGLAGCHDRGPDHPRR
jgi:hypothetical protein